MSVRSEWLGAYPVFLVVIKWQGREYFLSSKPVNIDSNDGGRTYIGGLVEDPEINFDLGDMGFSVDAISTPIACILQSTDIAKSVMDGGVLQDSTVEVSYVLEKLNSIQSYEDRTILLSGLAKQPIFGHKDQPTGYVEFSVEAAVLFGSLYSLQTGSTARLIPEDISALTNTIISPFSSKYIGTSKLIDVPDAHRGKALPIVLGTAGLITDQFGTQIRYAVSPAYVIAVNTTGQNEVWLGIAGHFVEATNVRIYDQNGKSISEPVSHFIRADGSLFAFVNFDLKAGIIDRLSNIVNDTASEYYISYNPVSGGGLLSRNSNVAITGGGDICLQFLQLGNSNIDYEEWEHLRPILNNYKFSGYINSTELSPLEFLENEIIPFLPISVIYGSNGLKPVLNLLYEGTGLYVKHQIKESPEWTQNSPIQTLTNSEDIINYYTLSYAYGINESKYMATMRITPDIDINYNSNFSTIYSVLSGQKYGEKREETESQFVHDENTAALICRDKVRFKGVSLRSVEYLASPRYGYIEIGDIILLTDSNLFSRPRKVQVIKKQWVTPNWLFVVKLEEHLQTEI